jgi:peptidoglycan hydrolase-like protein with peptidoglycan-binding domain
MVAMNEIIVYNQATSWSPNFRCTRRTAIHLNWTKKQLPSGTSLRIIQPSYNAGYGPSAGTHDKDAVFDVQIVGMEWWAAQRFLRECFWAAWLRVPPSFTYHIHMASLGCNFSMVGQYVPGQISDYRNHKSGLVGHYADNSWHPDPIRDFNPESVMGTVRNPDGPPPSDWDGGKVYVEKLHIGQRKSDSVRRLQYRLLHHDHIPAKGMVIDGWYGEGTRNAVRFFQNNMFDKADPHCREGKWMTNRQANRLFGERYNVIEGSQ